MEGRDARGRQACGINKENREASQDQYKLGLETLKIAKEIMELQLKAESENKKLDNDIFKEGMKLLVAGQKEALSGADNKAQTATQKDS